MAGLGQATEPDFSVPVLMDVHRDAGCLGFCLPSLSLWRLLASPFEGCPTSCSPTPSLLCSNQEQMAVTACCLRSTHPLRPVLARSSLTEHALSRYISQVPPSPLASVPNFIVRIQMAGGNQEHHSTIQAPSRPYNRCFAQLQPRFLCHLNMMAAPGPQAFSSLCCSLHDPGKN